jgi:hypothetical protein
VLLLGIFVLSMGDLYATIIHMHFIGLVETNPFAEHLVRSRSVPGLVLYKLGTVGIAFGLLLRLRRERSGELAAWCLLTIMFALTIHWHNYNAAMTTQLTDLDYSGMADAIANAQARPDGY